MGGGVALGLGLTGCGINSNECKPEVGAYFAGLALLGIGAATTLVGVIVWEKRVGERNEIDAKHESLIDERDGLANALSRLELSSEYRDDTRFVTLGVRF